jgi:hypothetical protein
MTGVDRATGSATRRLALSSGVGVIIAGARRVSTFTPESFMTWYSGR